MKRKMDQAVGGDSDAEDPGMQEQQNVDDPSDDDVEYYRQEVGEEPDEDLFPQSTKRRRRLSQSTTPKKKRKYMCSVQDQSQERTGGKTSMKHKKASQPGRRQRQPQRGASQHRQGKLSQQQRNTRQHRKPQNLKQNNPRLQDSQETKDRLALGLRDHDGKENLDWGRSRPSKEKAPSEKRGIQKSKRQHNALNLLRVKTGDLSRTEDFDHFQAKLWIIIILQFFFAVLGNGFTIYHFVAWERTWHPGIIFSFNLALCDLFYAISLLPLAVYYLPPKDWRYGCPLCKLDRFAFFVNLYGSTFFIACISLNRYVAIVHPFFAHERIDSFHAKVVSGDQVIIAKARHACNSPGSILTAVEADEGKALKESSRKND
ncbi:hypothetical protein E2320_016623 [Naja naja]|nr:hypothetical protein E2320_016623 [Naja naja]